MKKIILIAWQEYRQRVFRWGFLFILLFPVVFLGVPFLMALLVIKMEQNTTPLGYVDQSGLLANPQLPAPSTGIASTYQPVPLRAFETEAEARAALKAGEIQGYYVIPPDYRSTGRLKAVYLDTRISSNARSYFYDFLESNLIRQHPPDVQQRLREGYEMELRTIDDKRPSARKSLLDLFISGAIGMVFVYATQQSGDYLFRALKDEKANRILEVLLTSVSPAQLMTGKMLGSLAITLTKILVWGGPILLPLGLLLVSGYEGNPFLALIASPTTWIVVLVVLPSFITLAALETAIGASFAKPEQATPLSWMLSILLWIPLFLGGQLISHPHGPLAVTLSLLPITAPLAMLLRNGVTTLPAWQIALSGLIQIGAAFGSLWLAGWIFRLGMLFRGKKLQWPLKWKRENA